MDQDSVHPPFQPWAANRKLRASAWSTPSLQGPPTIFRTLDSPGDVAPDESPPPWSFHLGLHENLGIPDMNFFSNGFAMRFSELTLESRVSCILVDRHVLAGEADFEIHPSLFSPQHEAREDASDVLIETPDGAVLLRREHADGKSRFWLAVHPEGEKAAREAVSSAAGTSAHSLAQAECRLRSEFWTRQEGIDEDVGLLALVLEQLVFHLESPAGPIEARWSAASVPSRLWFELSQLFPLVKAWSTVDERVSQDLIRAAVSLIDEDGSLPASIDAQGQANTSDAPWPMLIQSCAIAYNRTSDSTFVRDSLPKLQRYLERCVAVFDPQGIGIPCWPTAASSFIPDTYDEGLASAALAGFLLAEIDALRSLSEQVGAEEREPFAFSSIRSRLIDQLKETFWDAKEGVFRDRYVAGASISRLTLSGLMPLMWSGLPEAFRNPLLKKASDPAFFGVAGGAPLWIEWENDPAPPPVPPAHQAYLLAALRHHSLEMAESLQFRVAAPYIRHGATRGPLPLDLHADSEAGAAEGATWYDTRVMSACLGLLSLPIVLRSQGTRAVSGLLIRMDRHRFTILSAAVSVIALAVLVPSLALVSREPRKSGSVAAASLARHYMALERFDDAIEILDNVEPSHVTPDMTFLRANLSFRMGNYTEAQRLYLESIDAEVSVAKSSMNLALALYREKRFDEAIDRYQQVLDTFGGLYPDLGSMAGAARDIVAAERDWLTSAEPEE